MSRHFEIVVFTAGGQEYADAVIDSLAECRNCISHRLYWDHVTIVNKDAGSRASGRCLTEKRPRQSRDSLRCGWDEEAIQPMLTDVDMQDMSEGGPSAAKMISTQKGRTGELDEAQEGIKEEISAFEEGNASE